MCLYNYTGARGAKHHGGLTKCGAVITSLLSHCAPSVETNVWMLKRNKIFLWDYLKTF